MRVLPPPGPERRRAFILLVVLVPILAWSLWQSGLFSSAPGPGLLPAAQAPGSPAMPAVPAPGPQNPPPDEVDLAALALGTAAPVIGRNPFRYGMRPPPPPPPRPATPPPTGPPTPPAPTGPPPVPLSLTGLATLPGEHRVVTLKHDDTGTVFQAVEGQVVDGRYQVVRIGLRSAVVAYVDGSGQRTLPLGGG